MNPKFLSKINDLSKTASKLSDKALNTAKKVSSGKVNEYLDNALKKGEELMESLDSKGAKSETSSSSIEKAKTSADKNSSKNEEDEVFL